MPAVHRLLASVNNAARTATVSASHIQTATDSVFRQPTTRSGNGRVRLTGGYTGADDATIDVEIRPIATGAERLSTPVFTGAGNGAISALTVAPGAAAQTLTATLVDAGTETAPAILALYGAIQLQAKASGAAGNSLTVTVTPALTVGSPIGALAVALTQGQFEWPDSRLDFNAPALNADGTLPDTAPRIVFNSDLSRVYRHYKRWQDGKWLYGVSPALAADIPVNSPVQAVTGTYSVAITNGTTTETYPSLNTLYDFLRALASSALVKVVGVIANDRAPSGQNAIDLPIRTSAWVSGVTRDKTLPALVVTCAADAVTDTISVVCETSRLNADLWAVTSAALGDLGKATTGKAFADTVNFTIPRLPDDVSKTAASPVVLKSASFPGRGDEEPVPVLAVKKGTLGAKASPQTFTLRYTARPDQNCDSANFQPAGVLSGPLLGFPDEDFATLDADFQTRLQALYTYRNAFIARNSGIRPTPAAIKPKFRANATKSGQTARFSTFATMPQLDAWKAFHEGDGWTVTYGALAERLFYAGLSARTASTAYKAGQRARVILADGTAIYLTAVTDGTTGASAPVWSESGDFILTNVVDGTVVWDADWPADETWNDWVPSNAVSSGELIRVVGKEGTEYHFYKATVGGTTGTTKACFYKQTPRSGPFADGSVVWTIADPEALTSAWSPSASIALDALFVPGPGLGYYVCTTAGTTGSSAAPGWGSADTLTDGSVTWTRAVTYQAISAGITSQDLAFVDGILSILGQCLTQIYANSTARTAWDAAWTAAQADLLTLYDIGGSVEQVTFDPGFLERYRSQCDAILIGMGISPGKYEAGLQGSAVWPDPGDPFWWEFVDADYLPLFTNQIYHACRNNADGIAVSTQEFAFALVCACAERLKPGDQAQIQIQTGIAGGGGYPVGATYSIALVGARPLSLAGGVTGDDTLTWQVISSTAGALDDYELTASEPAYSDGGIGFQLNRGTLPFALGDQFAWAVEIGGQFRWRKDAGSWSADTALAESVSLSDGLTAQFSPGPAPSFVPGDVHTFQVRQPYSPAHVQRGDSTVWQWTGATPTLTLTWAADQTVSCIGLLRHTLVAPATVTVALKDAASATLYSGTLAVAPGPMVLFLPATLATVRSAVFTFADAAAMAVGWVYVGVPFIPSHNATVCTVTRVHALERGGGVNPRGAYLGGGRGGELSWSDWLMQPDLQDLLALVDDCKQQGDEPLVVVPNVRYPAEAALCRISGDEVQITDLFQFQPNQASRRQMSVTLPLTAVVM